MQARTGVWALLAALALGGSGCAPHLYLPPVQLGFADSSAPVGAGRTGVQLGGASHSAMWDVDAASGTGRVRYGFAPNAEASAEVSLLHVSNNGAADLNPNAYGLRLAARYAPPGLDGCLSVGGGLGAGWSVAGPYTGADAGVVIAWENPYLVPFLASGLYLTVPLDPQDVDLSQSGDALGTDVQRPRLTWGGGSHVGLRVPIQVGDAGIIHGASLSAAVGVRQLRDSRDAEVVAEFGGALELVF